jgi:hypothetical protein
MVFVRATGAVGTLVTLTITPPNTRGRILYYLIVKYYVATIAGGPAPVVVTSTNMGNVAWSFPTAGAIGTRDREECTPSVPAILPADGVATIVCPATPNVIWDVTAIFE